MFKALRRLAERLARPEVGAAGVFKSMQVKAGSRWAEAVFSNVSWLMVASIALVLLLPFSNKELGDTRAITIVLVSYAIYMFILEIASRRFKAAYDRISFCIVRIAVNIITVSALVSFSSGQNSYFWLFYSLPIIQAIIYLRVTGVIAVTITVITLYLGTSWGAAIQLSDPLDITLLAMNSLILLILGFAFRWIFGTAKDLMRLRMLSQVDERMSTAINLDNILQITLEEALRAVGTDEGSIMVLNPKTDELEIKAWVVQGEFKQGKRHRKLKLGEGIAGHAAATHRAYNSEDIRKDERFVESFTGRSLRSMLSVPIVSHGRVLYVINADTR